MELKYTIENRRSIRKYSDKIIDNDIICEIIESANYSPSACNIQGWKFIIINDEKIKKTIVDEGGTSFIKDAQILIAVLYDNRTENIEYQDHIQSASAAIQNMILTAYSHGIGSCWICHLPTKKKMREILNIPWNYDVIACISMGYPKKDVMIVERKKNIHDIISYNKFDFNEEIPSNIYPKLTIKRFMKNFYFRLPMFLKKILKPLEDNLKKNFEN